MNYFVLTQNNTPVFKWVVQALGLIMQGLYTVFSTIGIENVALCIIIFTIVVNLLMLPLTVKQQKFTKMQAVMNPEIQAISQKYKNRKDQQSQMAMQEETKAVYEKYGTSPTGSCLQLLIQFPILLALYQVIKNVAAYVPQIKEYYTSIINLLSADYIKATFDSVDGISSISSAADLSQSQINSIVDILSGASAKVSFSPENWTSLIEQFPAAESIYKNVENINSIGFGINLSQSPSTLVGMGIMIALIIPALAGLTQWVSAVIMNKVSQVNASKTKKDDNSMSNSMNQSMKMMTVMMPIMSIFFCYSLASGIGVYWICSAVFRIFQTLAINKYFSKVDVQDIIDENLAKQRKKREKKGIYADQVKSAANINTKSLSQKANVSTGASGKKDNYTNSTEDYHKTQGENYNPDSISARANMLRDLNRKNK